MQKLLSFLFILQISVSLAQNIKLSASDFDGAQPIIPNKPYTFQESPKGHGAIQEFPINNRSDFYFKEERNTIWLIMDIPFNGILGFEIRPHSIQDDYDWMLFNYGPGLKERIKNGTARLLRSNNCRNDISLKGKTGIADGFINLFESPGLGKSYSKPLAVKKGQKLALIIDNIYDLGLGFDFISDLKPNIFATRTLHGIVKDQNTQQTLAASIICEDDSTGIKLAECTAGKDGTYSLEIPADRPVNISALYPEYLFQTADIKANPKDAQQNFNLEKADSADKFLLFNIHFTPDKDLIRQNSEPELARLISFLKSQKNWDIRIIGNTNNNPFADARYLQKLSFNRAIAVKKYLIENGVSEKRISCAGMGGKRPFIITRDAEEGLKNLRVEVVLSR